MAFFENTCLSHAKQTLIVQQRLLTDRFCCLMPLCYFWQIGPPSFIFQRKSREKIIKSANLFKT